ncbi:MAG: glycosyltransferase family 2 protein [Bacteroidaceae bacterium]
MLSILIPSYNFDCSLLVDELRKQADGLQISYEILVADDCSEENYRLAMRKINAWPHCQYLEQERNVGRAIIRNTLARKATKEWLLFIDADALIVKTDFLATYLKETQKEEAKNTVFTGGLVYPLEEPEVGKRLRHLYGLFHEQRPEKERNKKPYRSFSSFNFFVAKQLFMQIPFDETFTAYGHEDTYLGMQLEEHEIPIKHLDNPLQHDSHESDEEFLIKTRTAIRSLFEKRELLLAGSPLLQTFNRIRKFHVIFPFALLYLFFNRMIARQLSGKRPNLTLFSLYKLSYLAIFAIRKGKN